MVRAVARCQPASLGPPGPRCHPTGAKRSGAIAARDLTAGWPLWAILGGCLRDRAPTRSAFDAISAGPWKSSLGIKLSRAPAPNRSFLPHWNGALDRSKDLDCLGPVSLATVPRQAQKHGAIAEGVCACRGTANMAESELRLARLTMRACGPLWPRGTPARGRMRRASRPPPRLPSDAASRASSASPG